MCPIFLVLFFMHQLSGAMGILQLNVVCICYLREVWPMFLLLNAFSALEGTFFSRFTWKIWMNPPKKLNIDFRLSFI